MALKCTPDIGDDPAYNNHSNLPVLYFHKRLNACLQLLTTKEMISLRLEGQERNEESGQLKNVKLLSVTITQLSKNYQNFVVVAGGGTNNLQFNRISQSGENQNKTKRRQAPELRSAPCHRTET